MLVPLVVRSRTSSPAVNAGLGTVPPKPAVSYQTSTLEDVIKNASTLIPVNERALEPLLTKLQIWLSTRGQEINLSPVELKTLEKVDFYNWEKAEQLVSLLKLNEEAPKDRVFSNAEMEKRKKEKAVINSLLVNPTVLIKYRYELKDKPVSLDELTVKEGKLLVRNIADKLLIEQNPLATVRQTWTEGEIVLLRLLDFKNKKFAQTTSLVLRYIAKVFDSGEERSPQLESLLKNETLNVEYEKPKDSPKFTKTEHREPSARKKKTVSSRVAVGESKRPGVHIPDAQYKASLAEMYRKKIIVPPDEKNIELSVAIADAQYKASLAEMYRKEVIVPPDEKKIELSVHISYAQCQASLANAIADGQVLPSEPPNLLS